MDPVWIAIAFALGFIARQIKLPPLLGFLAAGFVLNAMGVEGGEILHKTAELGVQLLLFSIGLKLKVKNMLQPMIWAGATIHMVLTMAVLGTCLFILSLTGISGLLDLNLRETALIAFSLSFSSTVFAVKILEEKGAVSTLFGRTAIGILVMQDILAVIFLSVSSGKAPSPWALALLPVFLAPGLIKKYSLSVLLNRSGHGELLVLLGILIPVSAAYLFEVVGLKPDLGALLFGILLAGDPKADELSKSMMSFKDLFLVGFFLTIGLSGMPTLETLGIALLLVAILPLKTMLYFFTLTRFRLRARTSAMTAFSLTNYSEFGLIVGAAALAHGWLPNEWMVIFALALSFSFVAAAPLNISSNNLFIKWSRLLHRFERKTRLPDEKELILDDVEIIVLGMGRTGTSTYDVLSREYGKKVLGIDADQEIVKRHQKNHRHVVLGDVTDSDFWDRIRTTSNLGLIVLATRNHSTHLQVLDELKKLKVRAKIAALCRYKDEESELKQMEVDIVFNLYTEAGMGFANHILKRYDHS